MQYNPTSPEPTHARPSVVQAYLNAWRRAFDFQGVSTRMEYWSFVLINWSVFVLVSPLFLGLSSESTISLIIFLFWVILVVPSLSVLIRRVRDATGSGWFTFIPAAALGATFFPARDRQRLDELGTGYQDVWRRSADYLGYANRTEFWTFVAINLGMLFGVAVIAFLSLVVADESPNGASFFFFYATWAVLMVLCVAMYVAGFPLVIRRVRSATGSGWWYLIVVIPWIGLLVLLVFFLLPGPGATDSRPSTNRSTTTDDRPRWFDDDGPAAHRPMPAPTPTSDRQLTPDDVRPWWLKKDESGSTADDARAKPTDGRPRWFDDDGPVSRRGPKTQ